jgi:hypothetical protein
MSEPISLADPLLRQAIRDALSQTGELLVFIRHIYGMREWWLVTNDDELEHALGRATTTNGASDAVEVYATGELPFRERDAAWLRARAVEVLAETDVVLARKRAGDPELHEVEETDQLADVDEWLASEHEGEPLIGPHPLLTRNEFYPTVNDAFLAYSPLPDGSVRPGSY